MKRAIVFGVGSFMVAFVTMLLLTVDQSDAREGRLHETFSDITLPGWHNMPEVLVKDGALHIPAGTMAYPPGNWENMRMFIRMRCTDPCRIAITYRTNPTGTNLLGIDGNGMVMGLTHEVRDGDGAGLGSSAPITLPENTWFELTVTVIGGEHRVELNGELVFSATEQNPFQDGGVTFETLFETTLDIDELTITTATSLPSSPTPLPQLPSSEPTPCVTRDGCVFDPDLQCTE